MNRMEVEARSEECMDYSGDSTVMMKNSASLGRSRTFHLDSVKKQSEEANPERSKRSFSRVSILSSDQKLIYINSWTREGWLHV